MYETLYVAYSSKTADKNSLFVKKIKNNHYLV